MKAVKPGMQGFLITCDGRRERQASTEALNVIEYVFEELVNGKDSSAYTAAVSEIEFTYSDSCDSEDDDRNEEGEEDKQAENPAEDGANNGNTVEENPDPSKKDDHLHEAETRQAAGDVEEVSKRADEKSKVDEETPLKNGSTSEGNSDPAKKDDHLHEAGSGQAAGDDVEAVKQTDGKRKVDEEPHEKKQCCDTKKLESRIHSVEMPVDKLIEVKELGAKSKRRFFKLDSGCNGVVFIKMRRQSGDPSPTAIVEHMMESVSATKKHVSRFLLRVLPVELSCFASDEEITRAIKPLIEQYFPVNTDSPVKFAVQYDTHAAQYDTYDSDIKRVKIEKRTKIIHAVAESVPGPHEVDLKNPEKTILVRIVKTLCFIGVVEKYNDLKKYNLRQLTRDLDHDNNITNINCENMVAPAS